MKVKHVNKCPICHQNLEQDKINPLYSNVHPSGWQQPCAVARLFSGAVQDVCQVFMCLSPLADNPLHYYSHVVMTTDPKWIISQEFSVDIGSRYVLFSNDYLNDKSTVKSNREAQPLDIPVLLIPDFPSLEGLVKKIKLSITFS